jgi:hypothetical protein
MVDDLIVPCPENPRHVLIGMRIQAEAIGDHAISSQVFHSPPGIMAQILRIPHVDVRRFTIGNHQEQFSALSLVAQMMPGVS